MVVRYVRPLVLLAPLLVLALMPSASATAGSQTIYYVKDQAFLNMDRVFLAGDSGFGCWGLPPTGSFDPTQVRVGGCGSYFQIPAAQEGAVAILQLKDDLWFVPVSFHWRLVDADSAGAQVCAEGDASGQYGGAIASFPVTGACRVVQFVASGVTSGSVTLSWSA